MAKTSIALVLALLGACFSFQPVQAQSSRTFVSAASGNDANDCSRATPCRTFQGAHDKTNDQGEITVLDPGGYGAVEITKSVSIMNDGVGEVSILVSGGSTGAVIRAGSAGYVNLRGITIQGIGFGGGTGLEVFSAFSLNLQNCVIRNHTRNGINILPSSDANIAISDTLVSDNGGSGIAIQPLQQGHVKAVFDRVTVSDNSLNGLFVDGSLSPQGSGSINATVVDSVVANNIGAGLSARAPAGDAVSLIMLIRSVSANNAIGVSADGLQAGVVMGRSSIRGTASPSTSSTNNGTVGTFGDNYIETAGIGGLVPLAKK
jgi:hypothetical protein